MAFVTALPSDKNQNNIHRYSALQCALRPALCNVHCTLIGSQFPEQWSTYPFLGSKNDQVMAVFVFFGVFWRFWTKKKINLISIFGG